LRRAAREAPHPRGREGRPRDAAEELPRSRPVPQAQGVRRPGAPARRAAAEAVRPDPGRPVRIHSMAKIEESLPAELVQNYTTETPATEAAEEARAPRVLNVPGAAVGRRKEAIARVRLAPGGGSFTVNGRAFEDYFPNKLHQQL